MIEPAPPLGPVTGVCLYGYCHHLDTGAEGGHYGGVNSAARNNATATTTGHPADGGPAETAAPDADPSHREPPGSIAFGPDIGARWNGLSRPAELLTAESVPVARAEGANPVAADARAVRKTRREELSAFLKSRRARITPQEVGLPVGSRRRTPGLRREEVAQLSGVGVTWYTWLEQGRDIKVSVQVLDAISRTLGLDGVERAHLYALADVPAIPTLHVAEPVLEELQVILDHLYPLPAVLCSARYDVLAHNGAYAALFPGFLVGTKNILRKVFLTPACCNPYTANKEYLGRMVGYLRAAYVKNLHDPVWVAFIDQMCSDSPLFAELWARNDVGFPVGRTRAIRNLVTKDVDMIMTSMSLPSIAGAWVQIMTPADEDGWTALRALLAMSVEERERPWLEHFAESHAGPPA